MKNDRYLKKLVSGLLRLFITFSTLIGCSPSGSSAHEHTFASFWVTNDEYHWHPSTCGHDVKGDEGRHEFTSETNENGDTVYTCSICHYSYSDGNNDDKDTYTITWKNYDGTILEIDNNVKSGIMPTYDGATPTKESDNLYKYYFAGWTPELEPVTKDATYTATFSSEEITYTIDFDLNGGTSSSYNGPIEVKTFSKGIFFFDCVKEDWQFRGWEYNNEKIFDEKGNQLKNVTLVDNMVFKAIYSQTVRLTITTNMPEAGTITGEGEYPYNTYVDVSVKPNQGYKFVGWYYQNTLLSNTTDYKYMMWDQDITLEARFELDYFKMRVYSNSEEHGLVLLRSNSNFDYLPEYQEQRKYTSDVTIAAYSKSDVRFLGWYDDNNNLVTTNAVYTFVMPNYDYTLEAKWNYFTINYNLNGGTNNPNNPDYYTIDSTVYLQNPTKVGYEFIGWEYNGEIIDTIDVNLVQDITLEAIWSPYEYEIKEDDNGKYAVIIGYDDSITDVIIPENIILSGEEIPVKEISQTAFKGNQKVKSITVSNKVTTIDEYAFAGCTSLESIYIPDSVTTIGSSAFEGCSNLTTVTISENSQLTSIGSEAFYNCSSLTSIYIPDSVTTIGGYAFSHCSNLTTVTINEGSQLTTIGEYAFSYCSSLTSIYIPDSVTTIGERAFSGCYKLTIYCEASSEPSGWASSWNSSNRPVVWGCEDYGITVDGIHYVVSIDEENVKYIRIIGYTGSSTNVVIPSSINVDGEDIPVKVIAGSAFKNNDTITSITIPDSVTTIGSSAFRNCSNLTTVTFGENSQLTTIGDSAFRDCSSLTSINIPDSVTTINSYAFYYCSNLTTVTFNEGSQLASIGSYAFSGCSSLTSIYIHDSVTTIGSSAFRNCSNLTTVTFGENSQLTSIGEYAFYNCFSLTSIYIPDSVTTIGGFAFYECSNLTTATVSENSQLTSIGEYAFYNCFSLTSINIPDSVTTINSYAFYYCSNLTTVTFNEGSQLASIGSSAFSFSSLTSINIPDSVTTIGGYAFYSCSNLTTVTINEGSQLTTIGEYAFSYCSSLTSINIPDSVTTINSYAFYYCSNLTIYCEASSKPSGWSSFWNSSDRPVVWNCTYDEYLETIA